jgi:queuine/archaeosine tRNA-ribosyltransferase
MFRRKNKEASAQSDSTPAPAMPMTSSGGYVVTELPTYHAGKRKVVVYTSDAQGRIVKTFKKG